MEKNCIYFIAESNTIFSIGNILIGLQHYSPNFANNYIIYYDKNNEISQRNQEVLLKISDRILFKQLNDNQIGCFLLFDLLKLYDNVLYLSNDILIKGDISQIIKFHPISWCKSTNLNNDNLLIQSYSNKHNINFDIEKISIPNCNVIFASRQLYNFNDAPLKINEIYNELSQNSKENITQLSFAILNLMYGNIAVELPDIYNMDYSKNNVEEALIVHTHGDDKFWNNAINLTVFPEWTKFNKIWEQLGGSKFTGKIKHIDVFRPTQQYLRDSLTRYFKWNEILRYATWQDYIVPPRLLHRNFISFYLSNITTNIYYQLNMNGENITVSINFNTQNINYDLIQDIDKLINKIDYKFNKQQRITTLSKTVSQLICQEELHRLIDLTYPLINNYYNKPITITDNNWNVDTLQKVTNGKWLNKPQSSSWHARGVSIWNASFRNGDLVFMRGGRDTVWYSTLKFIKQNENKIAGVITDSPNYYNGKLPTLLVKDITQVTRNLGLWARDNFHGQIIAVTGSAGKSTTCAMLKHVLSNYCSIEQSLDNQNLSIGILWNMASMNRNVDIWTIEIAVSACDRGAAIVRPDIAIVTNISETHLDLYKNLQGLAAEKSKLLESVKSNGIAVINRDIPYYDLFESIALRRNIKLITYGTHPNSTIKIIYHDSNKLDFNFDNKRYSLNLDIPMHTMNNALAVIAIALIKGFDVNDVIEKFSSFKVISGRGVKYKINFNNKNICIIDDSFNANPLSMRSSISTFFTSSIPHNNRICILGDMLELGENPEQYHILLKDLFTSDKAKLIVLCGPLMKHLYSTLQSCNIKNIIVHWYENVDNVIDFLKHNAYKLLTNGDNILIKSSHGTGLYKLVNYFKTLNK